MPLFGTIRCAVIALLGFFLTGCFEEEMPEVNNENCKTENILKIKSKSLQQEFSSQCLRRGEFKASPEKSW